MEILSIDVDLSTALVKDGGTIRQLSYTQLFGVDPIECIRRQYDPAYKWLSFRRALLSSPEYPLAVALALESAGLALADAKLTSAIDACLNQGAEPEEVAAFQSALVLYFSQLPMPEGVPIRDRIINLCIEHNIPYPDPAPGG